MSQRVREQETTSTDEQTDEQETTDVVIPTKDVDKSLSLQDRMTDNAWHAIGPARYFERNAEGEEIEDWNGVFDRVASNIADAEYEYGQDERTRDNWKTAFEQAMRELRFMPNSPTLMNAGLPLQQLSACFVVEPRDDMDDINESQSDASAIFKSGGGVGYAFHHLRPKGSRVASTGGVSSGPLSFMQLFDTTCETVKQGGKRRGAQMGIMHCQHPDIGRFAVAKRGEDNLSNFNISFGITDDFKEAVENDEMLTLYDPTTRPSEQHDLRDGDPFEVVPESAHFYDPKWEDAWNDEFDKPGVGLDGKPVETNFWRDYADDMATDFSEWRDQIDLEPGEPLELPAGFLWQLLIDGAWNNGEPGIFNLDETNREHSFDPDVHPEHRVHATNPCSEQPLEEYEACNLGHINLSLMTDQKAPKFGEFVERFPDKTDEELVSAYLNRALDSQTFEDTIQTGVRFLDNVVTQSEFPLDEISEQVRGKRKVGLGLMGFHQMLVQMGVEYGSDVSYEFAREIMRRIDKTATEYSHELAKVRGPFDEWEESKWAQPSEYAEWFEKHAHKQPREVDDSGYLMRNHNVTTIAPTGTTSMIGNTTGGCEPLFQVAFLKNVGDDIQGDQNLVEFDDFFLRTLEANDVDVDAVKDEVKEQMVSDEKTFEGADSLETVPDDIGELFVTTGDLSGEQHIRMQAAFQEYCDSGISKTINAPNDATFEEVSDAFMLALDLGVKGTTIYRAGSRKEEVKKENVDNYQEETLGDVADEELVKHLVDQRNLSVKAEAELRDDLGVYPDDEETVRQCPDCESENVNLAETCPFCPECGWSKCQ
jgi:ribonucleoside-diphosphate reductase alpha chain